MLNIIGSIVLPTCFLGGEHIRSIYIYMTVTDIKVVSVNENEEAKQEEAPEITEEVEQPPEEVEIAKTEEEPKEEVITEPLKNHSKTEKLKDKMVTCPKAQKSLQLRNFRYKH